MKFSIILLSVAILWGIAVITPGPNFFITVKAAIGQDRRSALFVALGTSLFAATMPSDAPLWLGFMSVALMFLISILWYTSVAYVFSLDRFRSLYLNSKKWIERSAGAIFIGFGIKLVVNE